MKKSTKVTKAKRTQKKVVVAPVKQQVVVVHNRWQRFWGVVALVGLFLCGFMLGMDVQHKHAKTNTVVPDAAPMATVGGDEVISEPTGVCGEIERLLMRRLPVATDDVDERIERAKTYATLAERGCAENSAAYVELARQELEIARAIEDDEFDHNETIEVVETYKRLNMQAAAEEIFEKAKKLTNPAIDFILQVEKIINE